MPTIIDYFKKKNESGQKLSVVTCYDYSFARLVAQTTIDAILIGDSLGMVVQGHKSTLPVTLDEIIYHAKCVRRGAPDKYMIVDLPFLSYQVSIEEGIRSAGRVMKETEADAIKLESVTEKNLQIIKELVEIGVPVMGHLGLTPQSFQVLGGYKVQGKIDSEADQIVEDAKALENAGAFSIVLEMLPEKLGQRVTEALNITTIGIGAGRHTSGQVLVITDLLGMNEEFQPKFLKKYVNLSEVIQSALQSFANEVVVRKFPGDDNFF